VALHLLGHSFFLTNQESIQEEQKSYPQPEHSLGFLATCEHMGQSN